jgi:hypothetical protein
MMKAEEFIDKLFELLGMMQEELQEHKCENIAAYNQQITNLFEQSAAVRRALLDPGKVAMQGLKIDPPPKDNSQEPLFRVVYTIDVNAPDTHWAAECAYRIMSDPASILPVLYVVDSKGKATKVDLSDDKMSLDGETN